MDFGILLHAIGIVGIIMLLTGLFVGWAVFVINMIKNDTIQAILVFLPIVTFTIVSFYHKIAAASS